MLSVPGERTFRPRIPGHGRLPPMPSIGTPPERVHALRPVTYRFRASLKHKDDGQTKFIKPNSQRQDIIIKYWVSIGSIHREQG